MHNDIKVSVIVPLYNCEKYIGKCIDSVIGQSYKNIEIIVVNDGSTDSSLNVCEKHVKNDNRVKIITQPNKGLSGARNTGMINASGEYLIFIDADDYVDINLVSSVVNRISSIGYLPDVVMWGYYQDNLENELLISRVEVGFSNYTLIECMHNMPSEVVSGLLGYAWNKAYRKSFIDDNNLLFEEGTSLIEDVLFNSSVFLITEKIAIINELLGFYVQRRNVKTLSQKKYDNLSELMIRGFESRYHIFCKYIPDNTVSYITPVFELHLVFLLNKQIGSFFNKYHECLLFLNRVQQFYDVIAPPINS